MPRQNDGFKDFVLDQLSELRGLTCRAMFGGHGLYKRGKFFAIIHKGRLYFKVTTISVLRYKEQGMLPFRPNPKQTLKSFYEVPIDIIEDGEALSRWAAEAVEG
jgi:DNA transformation protein and related proteins